MGILIKQPAGGRRGQSFCDALPPPHFAAACGCAGRQPNLQFSTTNIK
jgi:hypothetical protein